MPEARAVPRWAGYVPAVQAGMLLACGAAVAFDAEGPVAVTLLLTSPLVLATALGAGCWVSVCRGGTREDGTEYVVATAANVLTGAALALSLLVWAALVWLRLTGGLPD